MDLFQFELRPPIVIYVAEGDVFYNFNEVINDILSQGEIPIARVDQNSQQFRDCFEEFKNKGKIVKELIYTVRYPENYIS